LRRTAITGAKAGRCFTWHRPASLIEDRAVLGGEQNSPSREVEWQRAVDAFMNGPGAAIAKSEALIHAFDAIVRGVTANPKNAGLSFREQLEGAFKIFADDIARAGLSFGGGAVDAVEELDIEAADTQRLINVLACVERLEAESIAHHFGRRIAIGIELNKRGVDWHDKVDALMKRMMN
jgi:hypothetical protein